MSISWLLDVTPRPTILVLPAGAVNLDEAHAAIELWEHYKKRKLDDTQRLVVEVMMATRADGRWAAATTGREMPRQNGKGDEIEVVELWGLVQRSERIMHTIHDAVLLATETQSRLLTTIESNSDLRRLMSRAWQGTGQQMIEMRNGGIIWYRTRSGSGGGRGVDEVDRVVLDEAQHVEHQHVTGVSPTLLVSANPQLNALGTGGIAGKSEWWWQQRWRALGGMSTGFGYVGHTAEQITLTDGKLDRTPIDPEERKYWHLANPALTRRPELIEFLEEQMRRLGPELFAREHLGVWDPPNQDSSREVKLPADAWARTITKKVPADPKPGESTLTFDVSKDGEWCSVAVGVGSRQAPYVELIRHDRRTDWLPAYLVEVYQRRLPAKVICNNAGPASAVVGKVLEAFAAARISADVLHLLSAAEYKQACGAFYTAVVEGSLRRSPTLQGPLDVAAGDATERALSGAWVWDVRSVTVPICPLVAVSIAPAFLPVDRRGSAYSETRGMTVI